MKVPHLLLGSDLKQGSRLCIYLFFYLQMSLVLSTIPQDFTGNFSTEVSLGKSREQQHSMSTWHMGQHISHQGTAGVFWCVMMNSQPRTLSLFIPRGRDVHARRTRSLELITGEKTCRSWDIKEGKLDFPARLLTTGSLLLIVSLHSKKWNLDFVCIQLF